MKTNSLIQQAIQERKITNPTTIQEQVNLKVESVAYFKTRRGVGYNAKTNYPQLSILNDGQGGETYIHNYGGDESIKCIVKLIERGYDEFELESLIDDYELGGNDIDMMNYEHRSCS